MIHSFDSEHARLYGMSSAVLLHHIQHWILRNRANGEHLHEGRTWTYNSVSAYKDLFPYLSYDQVRRALERLVAAGVLVTGNFGSVGRDRTTWYAFRDERRFLPPLPDEVQDESDPDEGRPVDKAVDNLVDNLCATQGRAEFGESRVVPSESLAGRPSAHLAETTNGRGRPSAHLANLPNPSGKTAKWAIYTTDRTTYKNKRAPAGGRATPARDAESAQSIRAGELPVDWVLPPEWAQWTREAFPGWSAAHLEVVAASFHAHWRHRPGRADGSRKTERRASWSARWREWCHRALPEGDAAPHDLAVLKQWWRTELDTLEQGRRCGLKPYRGERLEAFRQRIRIVLQRRRTGPPRQTTPPPSPSPSASVAALRFVRAFDEPCAVESMQESSS